MKIFPGYDARSPALKPSPAFGNCLGPEWQNVLVWVDSAAKIFSGDYVQLGIKYDDGTEIFVIKQLLATKAGRWWIRCNDGVAPLGCIIQPFSCAKVVALTPYNSTETPHGVVKKADEATRAHFASLSEDAVREWRELGHVDGVPFPGLRYINFTLEDGSRNPEWRAPVPL